MINQEEIKKIINEFFDKAGCDISIKEISEKQENDKSLLSIDLGSQEAKMLIGKQGAVLADLQLILRKIIKRKLSQDFFLNLDVDNYKKSKEDYLRELARRTADEAVKMQRERELLLSSPFDRRIVHLELIKRKDVVVESVGEKENRRIIIKPIS